MFERSVAALLLALVSVTASAGEYVQTPGSTLTFATQYQGEVFVGRLPGFTTRMRFDPARLDTSKLDVLIPLGAVVLDNPDGVDTLKGAEFFDVKRFPQARFASTRFRSLGGNRYAASGTLTLRGVSRPVELTFTWTPAANPVLNGTATLKRLAFGIGEGAWADTDLIANDVAISTRVLLTPAR